MVDVLEDRRTVKDAMRFGTIGPREWRTVRAAGPVHFAGGEIACLWAC